jgi:predicted amidohydrolase
MRKTIIRGGRVVDPANSLNGCYDICFEDEKIIFPDFPASNRSSDEINAEGKLVLPGLVDMHVHISSEAAGFQMLAKAGVTTALDMMGLPDEIMGNARVAATGLTTAFLYPLIPGETISSEAPSCGEIEETTLKALSEGALGLKLIGGHYPLTPDAIYSAIKISEKLDCYCAAHAGSTENGSNLMGLKELIGLKGDMRLHVAHVNSYCRGQVMGDPGKEASEAAEILNAVSRVRSESYLSQINGTSGKIADGTPVSHVTRKCLAVRDYPQTAGGLERAILDGWAQVNGRNQENEIILLPPSEGLDYYSKNDGDVFISFAVNSQAAIKLLATSRKNSGDFTVDAISTDGGSIPRNETLKNGLLMVEQKLMTLDDFVLKASLNPARILGLNSKGHLSPGADADIIIVDPVSKLAEIVVSRGSIIIEGGKRTGSKDCVFAATKAGLQYFSERNMSAFETHPVI